MRKPYITLAIAMIWGLCSCGTKPFDDSTFTTEESKTEVQEMSSLETELESKYERESTTENHTLVEDSQPTIFAIGDMIPKGCDSPEEVVNAYLQAIQNADFDTIVSLRPHFITDVLLSHNLLTAEEIGTVSGYTSQEYLDFLISIDEDKDALYYGYRKEGRTDLIGQEYGWNRIYECSYEALGLDLTEYKENLVGSIVFTQLCSIKVHIYYPEFYPDEADYYDSVLEMQLIQDADEKWYLIGTSLQGKVKAYQDIVDWNTAEQSMKQWYPVLSHLLDHCMDGDWNAIADELPDSVMATLEENEFTRDEFIASYERECGFMTNADGGWEIDMIKVREEQEVSDIATNMGWDISHIFDTTIVFDNRDNYHYVTMMCIDGQWVCFGIVL